MKKLARTIAAYCILALVFVASCSPTTQITGTWKNPKATGQQYNRVLVAALTDNVKARQVVEGDLQAQLQQRGVHVTKSIDLFPPTVMRESNAADVILDKVKGADFDAILTAAVVEEETETRYVPGSMYGPYAPVSRFGWYGTFRGYYSYWYPTFYDPGYYREDKIYFLETNLYDADTENLLWSAQSRSYNPSVNREFSEDFARLTVTRMRQDGLIP
ncbi:DUF4136 domain-containing protein [Botryobacter ruber]|uniref:hypothetical protein n=1 Tax=Botryobacter ruber TaxID=2171629 RepID=UPI000E0C7706|nr:hypothetical protein [Botryobacter ruber]